MKKFLLMAFIAGGLFASSGQEVYDAKCAMCHKVVDMKERQEMMKNLPPQARQAMMKKFMATMKAPPINKVSARIKHFHPGKADFVAFVKEYITHPDTKKSLCMPMALKKFGVMPAIGSAMSEADKNAVALWMYDNFHEKWNDLKACTASGKNGMKCGAGKCGGMNKKPTMKCGPGKCGAM